MQQLTEAVEGFSVKLQHRQLPTSVQQPRPPSRDLKPPGISRDDDPFEMSVVGAKDTKLQKGNPSLLFPSALVPDLAPEQTYHMAAVPLLDTQEEVHVVHQQCMEMSHVQSRY